MGKKLILGPFDKGLRNDVLPFNIDNNSFPTLINAYQWRGRVKRKRGTQTLMRLRRFFDSTSVSYNTGTTTITLDGSGVGNILNYGIWTFQINATLIPKTITITIGANVYTDDNGDGILYLSGNASGTILYKNGQITIVTEANNSASAKFSYYPDLPTMGFRDLEIDNLTNTGNISFDTNYSYNVVNVFPYYNYNVSFYKNPTSSGSYVRKSNSTGFNWNGENYQQFWTTNYQNAFWATNGITVPFNPDKISMQFAQSTSSLANNYISSVTQISATTVDFTISNNVPLVIGDFVFANEFSGSSGSTLNFQTGYITAIAGNVYTVTFPNANIGAAGLIPGILQYLTNNSDSTKDCLRWYDGDPTNGNLNNPTLSGSGGWVNFCPPLSFDNYSIADLPSNKYYLVGCRIIFSYKDRLVVLGPVVQTSTGNPIYLQDTCIYNQNGTPYYTCSFSDDPTLSTTTFNALLVPSNQTATANSWYEDILGYGGFRSAGISKPIITMEFNEDVPIIGFRGGIQTRLIYTLNDIQPFDFYLINSEYGSNSTFSVINTDEGVITKGDRGMIITSQESSQRIDLLVPNQVFNNMKNINNGNERFCAIRDFANEWIYFTYPCNQNSYVFPTQTLFYNYLDRTWAVFNECYTCYGQFSKASGFTWDTVGLVYPTWDDWNDPWDSFVSNLDQPLPVGGNQQGFIMIKAVGTAEQASLYIKDISSNTVTSPDHCLSTNGFIQINDCLGDSANIINGQIFQVRVIDDNSFFILSDAGLSWSGTYYGLGTITRLYRPYIQTKQFPIFWEMGRKTRIGMQQYLFTRTSDSEVQILIFLSQNQDNPYNSGPIYPDPNTINSSLVYTTKLFTCPESINLGLTPFTKNLQTPTALQQEQIWHRINTSLIGDTVQIGITLSDDQMKNINIVFDEIEFHSMIMDLSPAGYLA